MKRTNFVLVFMILVFAICNTSISVFKPVYAQAQSVENVYSVFDESGNLLLQKQDVFSGDSFLTKDFKKYEIVYVDEVNKIARAKFIKDVEKPDIGISFSPSKITGQQGKVCLYMTHNDESYLPTEGYDSIYGAGGIHDVANAIKTTFELKGIKAYIDETLHIPHDTRAYSRSKATAKRLIETYNPDAIFDIHRDGASRSTYVKNVNGIERCKVRIVVGKASENFEVAEQFALYLLAVGEKVCDWLFLDIYYASGHYNQGLHNKALLFEMGSHLVEKELVLKSVEPLVNVINTAMFNTTVNSESGDLTINGDVTEQTPLINDALNEYSSGGESAVPMILAILVAGSVLVVLVTVTTKNLKRKKNKN